MTTPAWAERPTRFKAHTAPIHALTFSSGTGTYLLTGAADRSIHLCNPASSKRPVIQKFSAHGYEVLDLAVSGDNSKFLSVGGDKAVFLWDVAEAKTLRRWNGHSGRVNCCAFGGSDGAEGGGESVAISGSLDGTVRVWDMKGRSEKAIMTLSEARDAVSCLAVRGAEIYAGSTDGRVRVYDLRSGIVDTDVLGASVTSVTPSQDGEGYLASTLDSTLRFMDRPSGKCLQTFQHNEYVNETYRLRSTFAMGDSLAVSGGEDGSVFAWDVQSGELRYRTWHRQHGGDATEEKTRNKKDVVSAVAWNPAKKQLASAGGDGQVCVFDVG